MRREKNPPLPTRLWKIEPVSFEEYVAAHWVADNTPHVLEEISLCCADCAERSLHPPELLRYGELRKHRDIRNLKNDVIIIIRILLRLTECTMSQFLELFSPAEAAVRGKRLPRIASVRLL